MAERILISQRRESARQRDMEPMPAMERRRQDLRPILSASGAHAMVVTRLTSEIPMVSRDEEIGRSPESKETEYIMIEIDSAELLREHDADDSYDRRLV